MLKTVLLFSLPILIGLGLGAMLGATRSCEDGGCPLTANPWRGALYGGFMGLLFALSGARAGSAAAPSVDRDSSAVEQTIDQPTDQRHPERRQQ